MVHGDSIHLFYKSMAYLSLSKGLAVAGPYIMKRIVDSITATATIDLMTISGAIGLFGLARAASTFFQEHRRTVIVKFINEGLRRISNASFSHLL